MLFPISRDINSEKRNGQINLILYADGSDALNPIAQGLTYINASRGKKVLYMSLDEFSNTELYFNSDNTKGLSEMLYYAKSKKDNLSLKAEVCTSLDVSTGVYFMKGHNNPEDVKNLNEEELSALIKAVQRSSPYEEIVISRAFLTDSITMKLLNEAHRIYISALNYPSSLNRLQKIGSLIRRFEEEKGYKLNQKVVFCICSVNNCQMPVNANISDIRIINLPCSDNRDARSSQPSNEYLTALESALNKFEEYLNGKDF